MSQPNAPSYVPIAEVGAQALANECAQDSEIVLIDVREDWEFQQGAIPNALHIPLADIVEKTSEALGLKPDQDIVTYCHHGVRSKRAAEALAQKGFRHVRSLRGGIDAWATDVDNRVGRY